MCTKRDEREEQDILNVTSALYTVLCSYGHTILTNTARTALQERCCSHHTTWVLSAVHRSPRCSMQPTIQGRIQGVPNGGPPQAYPTDMFLFHTFQLSQSHLGVAPPTHQKTQTPPRQSPVQQMPRAALSR